MDDRRSRWRVLILLGAGGFVAVMGGPASGGPAEHGPGAQPPSFTKDVAPILYEHCIPCHRPGGAGPFSLMTYDEVSDRAVLVAETVTRRRMPPWLPEPGYGRFAGERRLSDAEIDVIRQWVAQGLVEGDISDLPPAPTWDEEWQLGDPDLVVDFPVYTLPAEGTDVYRNLVVAAPVAGVRYVRAIELEPGDPRVVHHARMMVDTTPSSRAFDADDAEPGFDGMDLESDAHNPDGFFLGWTPGKVPAEGSRDMAWRLHPGSDLVLQLHLRPTGTVETIRARVGLYLADQPPRRIPALIMLGSFDIDIPPGASDYVVTDQYELPVAVQVLSVYPHAHYLGKELQGMATLPNDQTEWLIRILDWDFNWQDDYRYAKPIRLPAGTVLSMRYTYDNSSANPQNPYRPPRRVMYGSKSTDEMADLILQVLPEDADELALLERDLAWKDQVRQADYVARRAYAKGLELAAQGRWQEALDQYRESNAFRSDDPKVFAAMARALASSGEIDNALLVADRAIQLSVEAGPMLLDELAATYSMAGRYDLAVRAAERALEAATAARLDQLADQIRQRLERYRRKGRF